jgi:hypothetical protein
MRRSAAPTDEGAARADSGKAGKDGNSDIAALIAATHSFASSLDEARMISVSPAAQSRSARKQSQLLEETSTYAVQAPVTAHLSRPRSQHP